MPERCSCYITQMPAFTSTVLLRPKGDLHLRLSYIQSVSIRKDKHFKGSLSLLCLLLKHQVKILLLINYISLQQHEYET